MKATNKRKGFGIIEWLIIAAILVVIGALVFVALKPQDKKTDTAKSETTTQATPESIDEVKAEQKALESDDGSDIDQELDSLTSDLENL
jgi:cytoskeletal protein RodZ